MNITFTHYTADKSDDSPSFTIEEHQSVCNIDITRSFKKYMKEYKITGQGVYLYGTRNLKAMEQLHHGGYLDITNGSDVLISDDLFHFKEQVEEHYLAISKENYDELPFDKIRIKEEKINGVEVFVALETSETTINGFDVSRVGEIEVANPEELAMYFYNQHLYCKKEDFELFYKVAAVENKKEIKEKFLEKYIENKSILFVEMF